VLDSVNLLKNLREDCKKPAYRNNPVCQLINVVPSGDGGTPTVPTPTLPSIPGLPGLPGLGDLLGRRLPDALTSGTPTATPSSTALYGGAS